ncbi:MAG: hypothetical protein AAFZ80_11215, partial [Cyanobacteria bacterium P01_A01_bin.105]
QNIDRDELGQFGHRQPHATHLPHVHRGPCGDSAVPEREPFFPFSGWKESFYGDLHGQSQHAVEFFTQTKVVVERWPKTWSRQF